MQRVEDSGPRESFKKSRSKVVKTFHTWLPTNALGGGLEAIDNLEASGATWPSPDTARELP